MLFPLGLRHDTESILDYTGESENSGNPVEEQVDNFPAIDSDGEVDQPVYEGPQTWSRTKQLMKANVLIDQLFDINSGEICSVIDDIIELSDEPVESIQDLSFSFGTNKLSQFTWSVVTWLKPGCVPLIASQNFCEITFLVGEGEISSYFFCSRTKPRT